MSDDLIEACEKLGAWMAAALDDPKVCDAMKEDICNWFVALAATKNAVLFELVLKSKSP